MKQKRYFRPMSLVIACSLVPPIFLAGCGGKGNDAAAIPPPVDDTRGGTVRPNANTAEAAPPQHTGMSTKQKVVLLVGAAALYYMYKKHKDAQNNNTNVQYYLSKNGRVYYRDQQHVAHWVTPPTEGIQVPEQDAQDYRDFQGYNKQSSGRDLVGIGND